MAACGGLEHIFDNPLPESPKFFESLSPWKQIKSMKPVVHSSFADIFGGLCFKDDCSEPITSSPFSQLSSVFSTPPPVDIPKVHKNGDDGIPSSPSSTSSHDDGNEEKKQYCHSDSFSSMNSESLSLCTEGLGLESCDEVEDQTCCNNDCQTHEERMNMNIPAECRRSRTNMGLFPPPISCIGRSGKPWVCFKSYRQDGRFILKEIRIPTQELLHARRENGRLRLQFIQSDEIVEDGDEEEGVDKNDDDDDDDDDVRNEENGEESVEESKY